MKLQRWQSGYPGLWTVGLILAACTILVGAAFIFDGTGVTSSATFTPARHVVTGLGVPARNVMNVWGTLFIILGLIAGLPLTRSRTTLTTRSRCMYPVALLWLGWAATFANYAASHHGFGLIGAITWATIAAAALAVAVNLGDHAHRG